MNRGTWRATVHGVVKSDTTEQLTLSLSFINVSLLVIYSGSTIHNHTAESNLKFVSRKIRRIQTDIILIILWENIILNPLLDLRTHKRRFKRKRYSSKIMYQK